MHADASSSQDAPATAGQILNDDMASSAQSGETDLIPQASMPVTLDELSPDQPAAEGFQAVQQSAALTEAFREPQQSRILHVCLGPLPSAHISCTSFYFLRSQPGKLTVPDLDSLDCGLLSEGPSLQMLHQVRTAESHHEAIAVKARLPLAFMPL